MKEYKKKMYKSDWVIKSALTCLGCNLLYISRNWYWYTPELPPVEEIKLITEQEKPLYLGGVN